MKRTKLTGIAIAVAALMATAAIGSPADAAGRQRHGGNQVQTSRSHVQTHRGDFRANRGHVRNHRGHFRSRHARRWGHHRQYRPRHRGYRQEPGYYAAPFAFFLGALTVLNAHNY